MQTLDIGEPATIHTLWYDGAGVAAEPTAITLTVTDPAGVVVVHNKAAMVGSESGAMVGVDDAWAYSLVVTLAGLYRYDVDGVVDGFAVVLPSDAFLVGAGDRTGPCEPWTTWAEVEACGPETIVAANAAQRESAIDQASEILWNLSGRVYSGICETTRPACLACVSCYPQPCGCDPVNGIDLGVAAPVWAAWDVTVDGVVLPPTDYTIVARRWLARTDGKRWPTGYDPLNPRMVVTWAYGRSVPLGGRRHAAMFAVEIAKSCVGDKTCLIPQRVTNISREGTTFTILDSLTMIKEGRTGIPMVDMWLTSDKIGRRPRPRLGVPGARGHRMVHR